MSPTGRKDEFSESELPYNLKASGGDALVGNTRSHPEHDG